MKKRGAFPFSNATIIAVLAMVASLGGYGGYQVYKSYGDFGANFDARPHTEFRTIDGDTIAVPSEDATKEIRVRLLGINAPEPGECFAKEAAQALEKKLRGTPFTFEKDFEAVDANGRLLRHLIITPEDPTQGIRLINAELLREGLARQDSDQKNTKYESTYREAVKDAESNKRGLWAKCPIQKTETTSQREEENAPHKAGCDIKGNISEKGFGKNYFLPRCANYNTIKVDSRKGEAYFCSEVEAQKSGFTKSESCATTFK